MSYLFIILIYASSASALDPAATAIEQAQALVVKKNRQEACAVLQRAIEANAGNAKTRAKLVDSLNQLSRLFFTDKGQKQFESAQAMMWDSPDMALNQLRSALTHEDSNLQVLENISRIQLIKQDCEGAKTTLASARALNPYSGDAAVLELRALYCLNQAQELKDKAKLLPPLDKWQEGYVQYLLAREDLQIKAYNKALDALTRVSEDHPGFPESYFAMTKAGQELEKDIEPWLKKYVSLCKAITPRERKRYALEPRLCLSLKEAEDELAKRVKDI